MSSKSKDNEVNCGFKYRKMNDRLTRLIFVFAVLACVQSAFLVYRVIVGQKPDYYVTTTQGSVLPIKPTKVEEGKG